MLLDGLHAFKDWHAPKFDSVKTVHAGTFLPPMHSQCPLCFSCTHQRGKDMGLRASRCCASGS